MQETTVGDVPVRALRVTYVGELGWELYCPTEYGAGCGARSSRPGPRTGCGPRATGRSRACGWRRATGSGDPTSAVTPRRTRRASGSRCARRRVRRSGGVGGGPRPRAGAAAALPGARRPAGRRTGDGAGAGGDGRRPRVRHVRRLRLHRRPLDRLRAAAGGRSARGPRSRCRSTASGWTPRSSGGRCTTRGTSGCAPEPAGRRGRGPRARGVARNGSHPRGGLPERRAGGEDGVGAAADRLQGVGGAVRAAGPGGVRGARRGGRARQRLGVRPLPAVAAHGRARAVLAGVDGGGGGADVAGA